MSYDLSQLTLTQLETMRDNAIATINRSTNAQSYTAGGGRQLSRMAVKDALELLSAVNREIEARSDTVGDMFIAVDFDPAEAP